MTERALSHDLQRRFDRILWSTLVAFGATVLVAFAVVGEISLRRTIANTADVVESLLGLYADPAGERTPVAPAMLADQLVGMGARFVITRTLPSGDGERSVYFLTPDMPAKRIETLRPDATPEEIASLLRREVAARGRLTYGLLHRRVGEFDIFVTATRSPYLLGLGVLAAVVALLIPAAGFAARRATQRAVATGLAPVERVRRETQDIDPDDLSRRVTEPAGVAEVTEIAGAINRLVARVEAAHETLEAFTADASHELRTPLTHLRAQAHWALAEGRSPEETRESLRAIADEVERAGRLVEDLLLLARGDNQELHCDREPFAIGPLLTEVVEITEAMAAGCTLDVTSQIDNGGWVVGDPRYARQILLNLASNAVRHTATGSITFRMQAEGQMLGVAVTDSGEGIAPEHLERVFDRFYRVETSRSRSHGGAGLGLAIARMLAELQGGRLVAASAPGAGSTFTFWLPRAERERA
ncbi:MAG: ATP-binding protein [Gemmatimonadota bacterium]|nr:ATP-binding protein [Gemmatimonadota bacterium]MDH4350946.1 ATP-binding protein [Gemmatimonadota bacterium]MDH5196188.1 ATP-binding protein [Gemmatimonadota bacterium]